MNVRQERFVQAYLKDPNATQAAIAAGYSAKTAAQMGAENLRKPYIAEAIAKAQSKVAAKVELTLEGHLEELARLRDSAKEAGQHGAAIAAEVSRGKAVGLYVERTHHTGKIEHTLTDEQREKRVLDLVMQAKNRKERGLVS